MTKLMNVTLVCIDTKNHVHAMKALLHSIKEIKFGKVKFLTDKTFFNENFETVVIDEITSKEQYSEFVIKSLPKYIDTDFCLIIQYDGYIINPKLWADEFFNYDYIGAPWWYDDEYNVGNGGFSLRSKKLMDTIKNLSENESNCHPEDDYICRNMGKTLKENYSIRFAPESLAEIFSFEPNPKHLSFKNNSFGFHGIPQFIL